MIRLGEGRRRAASEASVSSSGSRTRQWRLLLARFVVAVALTPALAGAAPKPRATPSGQPVPRYVATKFATVNARAGPGDDYRLLWTFHARSLPLQVIAETQDWRRVCDPDGDVSWVHRRTVAETRTVMRASADPVALRRRPSETSPASAMLAGRAVAALKGCDRGWCRLSVDRAAGWVRAGDVWGVAEGFQCRPAAPSPG